MLSMMFPAFPSFRTWGLIRQQEQLLKSAVALRVVLAPKKKLSSRLALVGESDP